MNCPNCGSVNISDTNFCCSCGAPLKQINNGTTNGSSLPNQLGVGTLTIVRPKNFVGCLIPYDVYIDGYAMGTINNGEQKTYQLYYGPHQVDIKLGFNSGMQQVLINEQTRNLVFNVTIKMGFIKNEIIFSLISSTN